MTRVVMTGRRINGSAMLIIFLPRTFLVSRARCFHLDFYAGNQAQLSVGDDRISGSDAARYHRFAAELPRYFYGVRFHGLIRFHYEDEIAGLPGLHCR